VHLGLDVDPVADGRRFRDTYGLGDRPYLIFLGRIDPGKGSDEIYRYFVEYQRRFESELALVIVGEPVTRPEPPPDVIVTGFVEVQTKLDALAGSSILVQPSYFESFSLALCEAWVCRRPALVQGRCKVLAGQARRSGGALPYWGFSDFAESLTTLRREPELRDRMGEAGRQYVLDNYRWDDILARYERFVGRVIARSRKPTRPEGARLVG
jgi:glycosyltransferase involved in cell wall biosynthesis